MIPNYEAQKWCMDKGYRIYPIPVPGDENLWRGKSIREFKIVVKHHNEKRVSEKTYTDKEWPNVIWSMYEWFYNKYAEKKERV